MYRTLAVHSGRLLYGIECGIASHPAWMCGTPPCGPEGRRRLHIACDFGRIAGCRQLLAQLFNGNGRRRAPGGMGFGMGGMGRMGRYF
jgi:hypothetical protein